MFQRLAFAVLCALLVGSPLRADYVVSSHYDTPTGPADSLAFPNAANPLALLNAGSPKASLGFGSLRPESLPGTSDVEVGSMAGPIIWEDWQASRIDNANYTLVVNLTDNPSGTSGAVSFSANFSGWVGPGYASFDHYEFVGATTQSLTLGDNVYDVTIDLGPLIDAPWVKFYKRSIMAHIDVSPAAGVSQVPEPSALLLAGAGASALLAWSRRRKQARAD